MKKMCVCSVQRLHHFTWGLECLWILMFSGILKLVSHRPWKMTILVFTAIAMQGEWSQRTNMFLFSTCALWLKDVFHDLQESNNTGLLQTWTHTGKILDLFLRISKGIHFHFVLFLRFQTSQMLFQVFLPNIHGTSFNALVWSALKRV